MITARTEASLLSVSDSQPVEDDDARYRMTEEERREFVRQWRRELPAVRQQTADALENIRCIARGELPKRRGARRASR